MTENIVEGFGAANAILQQQGAKLGGLKKGTEAINLKQIWQGFGIDFGGNK